MICPYQHCGVTTSGDVTREGHCYCEQCHAGPEDGFPVSRVLRAGLPDLPDGLAPRASMCDKWYAGIGDYRPWHRVRPEGCLCGAGPHALPGQHGEHCPVFRNALRKELGDLAGGRAVCPPETGPE